jgi:hypothetical protein
MVLVERQGSGQDPSRSYTGAPRKIQSPSCSAISVHSDDETVNFTGCTELSAGRDGQQYTSSGRSVPNAHEMSSNGMQEYRDNSSPENSNWDSHSVHSKSVQSNESALSAMRAGISPPFQQMEANRQRNFKRAEQAANLLESQLDEVESSHGSYEVNSHKPDDGKKALLSPVRRFPLHSPASASP